jgi:hypothetical protein
MVIGITATAKAVLPASKTTGQVIAIFFTHPSLLSLHFQPTAFAIPSSSF